MIQFLLTDEESTNQLVSSIQKDNLLKQKQFLDHLKDGTISTYGYLIQLFTWVVFLPREIT